MLELSMKFGFIIKQDLIATKAGPKRGIRYERI